MLEKVKFTTVDEKSYTLDRKVAIQSKLVKGILEDLEESDDPIPLPNITSSIMEIFIKYGEIHQNDLPDSKVSKDLEIEERDLELINVPKPVLFEIILAANYLDVEGLLTLGCKALANDLKKKSIDEVYQDYQVPEERRFTAEEREKIEKEFQWARVSEST